MTRHIWVGKVIRYELCKKLKFDHSTKWYMHKPKSILENEMLKILWNFGIQTGELIPTFGGPQRENLRKWKERQILRPLQRIKNTLYHYSNWNDPQRLHNGVGRTGNWRISWDHPNYTIVEVCQNSEKSPVDLMRLAVS